MLFESYTKPEKQIARKMMLMINDINKKYSYTQKVTCITCNSQKPYPEIDTINNLE